MNVVINRFWSLFFCLLLISLFNAQFTHFFNLFSAIISFKIASSSSAILYHSFSIFIFTIWKNLSHLHVNFNVCMLFNLMSCSSTRLLFRIKQYEYICDYFIHFCQSLLFFSNEAWSSLNSHLCIWVIKHEKLVAYQLCKHCFMKESVRLKHQVL